MAINEKDKTYSIYQDVTGKSWSTAKTEGLTDGSFEQNQVLRERLLSGDFDVESPQPDSAGKIPRQENIGGYTADRPIKKESYDPNIKVTGTDTPLKAVDDVWNMAITNNPSLKDSVDYKNFLKTKSDSIKASNITNYAPPKIGDVPAIRDSSYEPKVPNDKVPKAKVKKPGVIDKVGDFISEQYKEVSDTASEIKAIAEQLVTNPNDTAETKAPTEEENYYPQTITRDLATYESVEDYRRNVEEGGKKLFGNNYKSGPGFKTPYYTNESGTANTEQGGNCIHGVCNMLDEISGKKFSKEHITGNKTFDSKLSADEGYLRIDPRETGVEIGDIIQYTVIGEDGQQQPYHAKVVIGKTEKNGIKYNVIAHNYGGEYMDVQFMTDKELDALYRGDDEDYSSGLLVQRYDPELAHENINKRLLQPDSVNEERNSFNYTDKIFNDNGSNLINQIVSVRNNSAEKLDLDYTVKGNKEDADKVVSNYYEIRNDIGKIAGVDAFIMDQLAEAMVGIQSLENKDDGRKERKYIKEHVPKKYFPALRFASDLYDDAKSFITGKESGWISEYWNDNANNVKSQYKTKEDFEKHIYGEHKFNVEKYTSRISAGEYQQKERTDKAKRAGYTLDNSKGQLANALLLAADNFNMLKEKYPKFTESQLMDLTILSHNAPGNALIDEYVDYFYLQNNDIDYINNVKDRMPVTANTLGIPMKYSWKSRFMLDDILPEEEEQARYEYLINN